MKKINLFLGLMLCAALSQAKPIYLDANIWDTDDHPAFYVHSWGSEDNDAKMIKVPGNNVYQATIPDGNTSVIFLRMNPASATFDWGNEWNRTSDLVIPSGKNCYKITGWHIDDDDNKPSYGEWSAFTPVVISEYYLAGSGFPGASWDAGSHLLMTDGTISFTNLPAGEYKCKVTNNSWNFHLGYDAVVSSCSSKGYHSDSDGNIVIELVSTGDITISVSSEGICVTIVGETKEEYLGAVPSHCKDVLLQGFFYDSYSVDSTHNGTLEYGDTRWKTLLGQAGEIGAYFDLVWLPPSSLASGTGYHPRQYANQNSDWGRRSDLERLISALHNSGSKVVADIVINHAEGLTSWCDMAVEDFGEYGHFEPDSYFITSTDEVNNPATKADTLAGDCWGYSKNSRADDGENWQDARDWAHDNPDVQEMFKAYLKWMKNEIHYDGWRYDKGDGFNNWHMDNYNNASEPYIAFMECWTNYGDVKSRIEQANNNVMALDFWTRYKMLDPMAGWDYRGRHGDFENESMMANNYWKKYAVTFVDNHDMCLRGEGKEFAGDGNSLSPALKFRLLGANAFILSMPGVPCIFYPHWAQYKEELKPMITARHLAGVHNESEVKDEYRDWDGERCSGYQATIVGDNGYLILCLGTKTGGSFDGFTKVAYGYNTYEGHNESYEMWVLANNDIAPRIIATPSASFSDSIAGIQVTMEAVGSSCNEVIIRYTTDGSDPTNESAIYSDTLTFTQTTTLKVIGICGGAVSNVQEYTYTYREPRQSGIRVRFHKPEEWEKVYYYAWIPGVDSLGNATSENIMGAYPGQRIYEDVDGWYSYEFDNTMDTVHFCINSGDDCGSVNVRSNDLEAYYDTCYGWRPGQELEEKQELELPCDTLLNPDFKVVIAPESGFFRSMEEGQEVRISAVGKHNVSIYYTLDGSAPTTASPLTAMDSITFTVNQTTTVRAIAYSAADKVETEEEASETYTYKAPQEGPITVKFIKPEEWETLYLYAFTRVVLPSGKYKDTAYPLDGKASHKIWPGRKWTEKDGDWYTYTFPDDIHEIFVIFTEGNKKPQTQDIFVTENTCYVWNPNCWKAVVDDDCDGEIDTEGIEEIIDHSQKNHETLKLIIDGRLVIIHNGAMYDIFGRKF